MKKFAALVALAFTMATSQAIAEAPTQPHYSTARTPIGTLLADPVARSAIGRRFPMLLQSRAVASGMANRMTLRSLKRFKPAIFTDTALAAIDADFAQMPGR